MNIELMLRLFLGCIVCYCVIQVVMVLFAHILLRMSRNKNRDKCDDCQNCDCPDGRKNGS